MIDTMLFDLDGTIVDTNELIIATFLHVIEGQTLEPYTRDHIIPHMGKPLAEQLMLFTGKLEVDDLIRAYREYNLRVHDELVRDFPHVTDVLGELHRAGIKLGVVTNKVRITTMKGLELFGLDTFMDVVVTPEDVKTPKPDPEGVLLAIEKLGSVPERTLMVGDSQYDLMAGQHAGARTAGVAWSMKGEAFLRTYDPDFMLQDMRDLLEIAGLKKE